ncbi:uncharacterized protein LOC126893597 [Daktulosphaira vitifoliae]|uniref:uncharacterized protein LOC126893597 n=1 Tax=Daktulosphaira vitifoliae TaxID=58002 RepID=UPI0021AA2CA0|nr:uncharacterized protein LOC126893597 [Daktulosphaira vitifoliae]
MNLLNLCFALIIILIQSLPSNFVIYKLIPNEKIENLNKILDNVEIWKQFENIIVRHGSKNNKEMLTVHKIFDNIDYEKYIDQNNIQFFEKLDEQRSSKYLYVDPNNYEGKIYLIFNFVRCRCWQHIKWFNRLLSYMTSDYDRICKEEIMKQEKTMTLKIKSLLLTRIQEYKELVQVLYDYACFFKSLFPEGKDKSLSSNFVVSKLISYEKIETLKKVLVNVDIWNQFKNIAVRDKKCENKKKYKFNNIFDDIDNGNITDQNNVKKPGEVRSSKSLLVNSSNYEEKVKVIFKFVRCKCCGHIKWFNRLLLYMTSEYDRICNEEINTQEKTMTLKIKSLLLTRIQEYKELVQVLYDYACFFKSLFLEGKDKVSDTDPFFSKLLPIINMPLPEGDYFANDFSEILNKSYMDFYTNSKSLCVYSKNIPHKDSYNKKYKRKLANVKYKKSFAEYISSQLHSVAKEIYDSFPQLPLNEKLE